MKKFKLMALSCLAVFGLAACEAPEFLTKIIPSLKKEAKVTSVAVSGAPASVTVQTAPFQLVADVVVENDASKEVTWSTSNASVATVSETGLVTPVGAGEVTITATSVADNSKSGSVSFTVVADGWDASTKAMMQEYLGFVVPYFEGSFVWTDEYFEEFACLTAESSVSADYNKAVAGFTEAGWEIEDYEDEVYAILELEGVGYLADIYEYDGIVSVDVYSYEIITEWPAEDIADALKEAGYNVELPVFEAEEGMTFQFSSEYDEEYDETYIDIIAMPDDEESEISPSDYVALFNKSFSVDTDEYGDYVVTPENKSCVIYVYSLLDDYYEEMPGFEVIVAPYAADYSIKASVESEFIITGQTATVSVEKLGADVPDDAVILFESDNKAVATVSAEGVITAVAEGKAVISAEYEGYVSSVSIFVRDSIPTEFTGTQIAEFKKLHDADGVVIPFNAHFSEVSYNEEKEVVEVRGDEVGVEAAVAYRHQLLDAGWVDLLEEQGAYEFYLAIMQAFGMDATIDDVVAMMVIDGIPFEKEVKVSESKSYFITAELSLDVESEEDEEGALCVDVYDVYMYSYAEAKVVADEYLAFFEIESEAGFPEGEISGSHYYVELDDEYGYVALAAYDTTATLAQLKEALEASGFVLEEVNDEGVAYLVGTSSDGLLDVEAMIYGDDAEIMVGPHVEESNGVTIDFAEVSATAGTIGAYSFDTSKASGQSDPAYIKDKKELRLYAKNTITFTSEETITSIFFDANTCGETKATGSLVSASVGTVSAVEGGFLWEGEANEVTLTASATGQVHINSIEINGGGEGGGAIVTGEGAEVLMQELCEYLFEDASAYEEEDGAYFVGCKWGTTSEYTLLSAVEEAANYLPEAFVYIVDDPVEDTWDDGDAGAFATYCTEDGVYCDIGSYISGTNVIVQFAMYEE